jgi:hypothetical protein
VDDELLVLHAVRLKGMASSQTAAARFDLDAESVGELLLDLQALGRVTWTQYGSAAGWSLTPLGKAHGERLLAAQLDAAEARDAMRDAYDAFLTHNTALRDAVTRWQLRPTDGDPYAANDHVDRAWDLRVLAELKQLSAALSSLQPQLTGLLERFTGYDRRFSRALSFALADEVEWIDGIGLDSCHVVWFELHEDFLATLGLER